ncbi:MAG: carboxypeptidase-like regulatory domain-containing protein [Myxococcota bacterium]|nr:carboxypeptidase-like regulatory domain-containing protein [Myxococcota bacterium]
MLLALALACSDPQTLNVNAADAFGNPIESAQIKLPTGEPVTTDSKGAASFEVTPGNLEVMAGKEGFIPEYANVVVPAEGDPDALNFVLFFQPEKVGFYGVGAGDYLALGPEKIRTVASDKSTWHGLENVPDQALPGGQPQRFVFQSGLRASELKQQNLTLSKLKFLETAEVVGVLGKTDVELDLWVADTDHAFEIKGTQAKDNYLIVTSEPLAPGFYAFHAQGILKATEAESLSKLPKEMQVAFPFEVK